MNLDDVVLTLENEREFHDMYRDFGNRSYVVRKFLRRLFKIYSPSLSDVSHIISYFNDRYFPEERQAKQPTTESETITTDFTVDKQPTLSKENSMSTAFLVTKHFVNGQDVALLPPAQVYGIIAAKEAELANLNKIENKPKSLVRAIEKGKADIKALIDLLDSQEPAQEAA